MALSIIVYI
jgi:hypothetical protein